ncbi:hypothetical protein KA005_72295 [bacterium]|nr:hypothetical protein [bacterium]
MARESYELAKSLLKPPLRVVGITAGTSRPVKLQYDESFSSLEEVYTFFRKKRPEGRWLVWIQDSDGQELGLDSKKWEVAIGK